MNKQTKGVVTVVAVLAIVAMSYFLFHKNAQRYAKIVVWYNGTTASVPELINSLEEDFIKAWAKALVKGSTDFSYKNETYNTKGGKKLIPAS